MFYVPFLLSSSVLIDPEYLYFLICLVDECHFHWMLVFF